MDRDSSELEDNVPALHGQDDFSEENDALKRSWSSPVDGRYSQVYTPPPHIAARFYRSANNRRRTSAASSRRNSISSSHSTHHSNKSLRRTYHSNAVAQQLRRASIIEGRKARLADRAAHVEQVRLRAALIQATPKVSNSEERALAAQQARERYLAKVAAACAEEVNRAKRVAEEMKERKAAEERQIRLGLEEKHAEAEKRRLEQRRTTTLRKPRTASNANTSPPRKALEAKRPLLSQEAAAARIQRAWQRAKKRKIVRDFMSLELSIDNIRNASFNDATDLLADEQVIARTKKIMALLKLDQSTTTTEASSALEDTTSVRTFLSAFMILGHPTDVFTKNGQQEQDLIGKAKDVLISFEDILSQIHGSNTATAAATDLETLSQAHAAYLTAFAAWKTRDARVLIDTMVDQFIVLDEIWQSIKDYRHGEVAEDYKEGIRDNQIVLLSKIKKLAGPERAHFLIKKAIRESRRTKPRRRPLGEVRPRPIAPSEQVASATTSEALSSENATSPIGASSQQHVQPVERAEIGSAELSRVFSNIPPNRCLVHELLIDANFKIEASPHSDLRNALNREICERMRQGIQEGQGEVWTVAVAENIRTRLLKLLKPGNSMYQLLSEVLDSEHVRKQCQQGSFSYENFFNFMADLLPRLCAPFRDEEVKALAQVLRCSNGDINASIEKLFGLLRVIDLMSLDYTNYLLHQSAPTLIREGPGYELRMFAQDLESGQITLDRTRRWWKNASVNVHTESNSATDPSRRALDRHPPTFARIYARGLIDLAVATGPLHDSDVPETLQADVERFRQFRADTLKFTAIGGILLTAKNLLKRDVRSQWKPEAKRILEALKPAAASSEEPFILPSSSSSSSFVTAADHDAVVSDVGARILSIIESSHGMPASSREHLSNIISRFLRETCIVGLSTTGSNHLAVAASASSTAPSSTSSSSTLLSQQQQQIRLTDPVLALLHRRLKSHLLSRLSASSSTDRVRVASTASEGLAGIGLGEFVPLVSGIADTLERVRKADLGSHEQWLRQVATDTDQASDDDHLAADVDGGARLPDGNVTAEPPHHLDSARAGVGPSTSSAATTTQPVSESSQQQQQQQQHLNEADIEEDADANVEKSGSE